ncbi:hypothetical protein BR93DRAFT_924431 [Coniochaeta sp. PMI_546]|nr:hypothetical protein BR93DRAFT_924431 [Coniochaeta sp. PMI_546]
MTDKSLPSPPPVPGRSSRLHTQHTPHTSRSHTLHHSGFYATRPLSPVSEVPPPSEIQTLQLEIDILHQQLAATKGQFESMDRQVAALKKENHQYRLQIDTQNHLVAQIANTLELVFDEYQVATKRFQRSGLPRMEQMPKQENGWI